MLLVDERIGSKDLLAPLQKAGIPCELQHLEYGDVAFVGRGIRDADVCIGVELKETRDLIACMRGARFAGHQLPGLIHTYDRAWLVTEGIWRASAEGVLEIMAGGWKTVSLGKQPIMAADLEAWLLTQIVRGGINYWHCPTRRDTIRFLSSLYHWWTHKSLEEHRSHQAIYLPPPDRASLIEPSPFVKAIVALVDGVGWDRATALEDICTDSSGKGSLRKLGRQTVKDLQTVEGIGKKTAEKILAALGQTE